MIICGIIKKLHTLPGNIKETTTDVIVKAGENEAIQSKL